MCGQTERMERNGNRRASNTSLGPALSDINKQMKGCYVLFKLVPNSRSSMLGKGGKSTSDVLMPVARVCRGEEKEERKEKSGSRSASNFSSFALPAEITYRLSEPR
jgi:hypothetical protein